MPRPGPDSITRAAVLAAFKVLPPGVAITTTGLAWLVGCCEEHRIRAAVSWLRLGGLLEPAGTYPRLDRRGRVYGTRLYRWSGREEIARVPHNPRARRFAAEQAQPDAAALAMAWLSRPLPGRGG